MLEDLWKEPYKSLLILTLAIVLAATFVKIVHGILSRRIQDSSTRYRARKIVTALGYVLVFGAGFALYGNRLGNVAVVAGIAGAGIAFSLQEVIASFAGYVAISFGGFYRVGDRVQLGGIRGDVIDISVLRTTLMELGEWVKGDQYSGRVVRIANSFVFKEPVFNYSGDFEFVWDEVSVPIRYGSDHREARRIIEESVSEVVTPYLESAKRSWETMQRQYRIEDAKLEPMTLMTANDNWIEIAVRYTVPFDRRRITKDDIWMRILDRFEATKGRVEIGSATIDIVGMPETEGK